VSEISLPWPVFAENKTGSVRRIPVIFAIPSAHFVGQMLKVGRRTQGSGGLALLQPFADGIADRSAGPAIDLFAVVRDSAVHGRVPLLGHFEPVIQYQVAGT
jgi:hypothetical protein